MASTLGRYSESKKYPTTTTDRDIIKVSDSTRTLSQASSVTNNCDAHSSANRNIRMAPLVKRERRQAQPLPVTTSGCNIHIPYFLHKSHVITASYRIGRRPKLDIGGALIIGEGAEAGGIAGASVCVGGGSWAAGV